MGSLIRGRTCPLAYRLGAARIAAAPHHSANTLYVVGGLYGNDSALHAIIERAEKEQQAPLVVFNGDFK